VSNAPLPPASSGFAPALEPRAIVSAPAPAKAVAKPDTAADSGAVAPPRIDMKVAAPVLPSAVLGGATRPKGDSAMKKILRAVSGAKDGR
jgi:hypothetical protein